MGIWHWILRVIDRDLKSAPDPSLAAKKTWRYLRLAMVAMVVGLGASILQDTWRSCWQGSISGYYYTPAQGFLVGALVTIGVCLFALKGSTDLEDFLLNLAGVCAPFVALVPTPNIGDCGTVYDGRNRAVNIANNVFALLVVLTIALAVVVVLEVVNQKRRREPVLQPVERWAFGIAAVAIVALWVLFYAARVWFALNVHNIAAIAMFFFIWLTVLVNARHLRVTRRADMRPVRRINRYTLIALLMLSVAVAHVIVASAMEWTHAVFSIEACLIILFAWFWTAQTFELWDEGLRPRTAEAEPPDAAVLAGALDG